MKICDCICSVLHQCFTGIDNKTIDPARVAGYIFSFVLSLVFFVLFIYTTIETNNFDADKFLIGSSAVSISIGAAATGVKIKQSSEPENDSSKSIISNFK